jgi:2-hydroxy-6-oxonona-2,4-dienedioate hydrolase
LSWVIVLALAAQIPLDELRGEADQCSTPLEQGNLNWLVWPGPGDRRPLLLLHGGFGSWTHWVKNIRQLRKTRSIWTVDIPGLGMSAAMSEPNTLEHFAREILESLDTLHGADCEFDLAGFSFGALIGSRLAARAQNRCHHFIACGAAGFGPLHVQVDLLRPPGADTPVGEAQRIHRSNLRSLMFAKDETVDELSVHIHGQNLARARFNSRRLARGEGFTDALPHIGAKLCGIWGEQDATAGGRIAIELRETIFRHAQPDCSFHILKGVGHWAMYEDAETFNRIVIAKLGGE